MRFWKKIWKIEEFENIIKAKIKNGIEIILNFSIKFIQRRYMGFDAELFSLLRLILYSRTNVALPFWENASK